MFSWRKNELEALKWMSNKIVSYVGVARWTINKSHFMKCISQYKRWFAFLSQPKVKPSKFIKKRNIKNKRKWLVTLQANKDHKNCSSRRNIIIISPRSLIFISKISIQQSDRTIVVEHSFPLHPALFTIPRVLINLKFDCLFPLISLWWHVFVFILLPLFHFIKLLSPSFPLAGPYCDHWVAVK